MIERQLTPDIVTFTTLINVYLISSKSQSAPKNGDDLQLLKKAELVSEEMRKKGIVPDRVLSNIMIELFSKLEKPEKGKKSDVASHHS